jgi:uncharacterized caspase-like protein
LTREPDGLSRDVVMAIGVNRLPQMPRLPALRFAEADAAALARTFRSLGIPDDRVQTLTGAEATFERIGKSIAEIPKRYPDLRPIDRVWFCFSGHGVTGEDGRTHLLVHDAFGDLRKFPERTVTVEQVINVLPHASSAGRILLLDACRNEVRHQAKSGLLDPGIGIKRLDLHSYPGVAIFSGCLEAGYSFENRRRGLGVFTAALIDILEGAKRPVTVEDLEFRLLEAVPRESMDLGLPYRQQPSLRFEPYYRAAAMLLFPHLLSSDDVATLRRRAENASPQIAEALWETLAALNPGDNDARALHSHFRNLPKVPRRINEQGESILQLGRLNDLLSRKEWLAADRETAHLLVAAAGKDPDRVGTSMIRLDQVASLRRADLAALNELWMHYSDGKFGLTPQLARLHAAHGDIAQLADSIGWRKGRWIFYAEAEWHSDAPNGHLPIIGPVGGIKPVWPISYTRQALTAYSGLGLAGYNGIRYYRDGDATRRATASIIVDDSFGWAEYNRLAIIALADIASSAARGKVQPLGAAFKEAWARRLVTNYTQLLSVVWAVNRIPLLRHFEKLINGA